MAQIINGYPFDSKLFSDEGGYPLIRIRDLDAEETATRYVGEFVVEAAVDAGDVLIGMDGEFNVGRWLGSEKALLNQRMCCVRSSSHALATFLRHALPIPLKAINEITYSTTVKHLSSFDVKSLRVALPDDAELAQVSNFLDRETAKIDALIAEQEKLLALLAEKRQATIFHAVTRGLDPNAPMKHSGISWLGEVPAHWEARRLKDCLSIVKEVVGSNSKDYTLLSLTLQGVIPRDMNNPQGKFPTEFDTYQAMKAGDLVFCLFDVEETPRAVGYSSLDGMVTGAYTVCRSRPDVAGEYLYFFFLSRDQYKAFKSFYTGLRNVIRKEAFLAIPCPVPPAAEQAAIVDFLVNALARADALQAEVESALSVLKERRSALIAAAVTGQIDVRGAI